jgi:hypothetical protein
MEEPLDSLLKINIDRLQRLVAQEAGAPRPSAPQPANERFVIDRGQLPLPLPAGTPQAAATAR